jgi:putative transposase
MDNAIASKEALRKRGQIYFLSGRRRVRYMEFMRQAAPSSEVDLIRAALQRGQLTGSARFVDEIEKIQGQRVELRGQGRPRSNPEK